MATKNDILKKMKESLDLLTIDRKALDDLDEAFMLLNIHLKYLLFERDALKRERDALEEERNYYMEQLFNQE